MVALFEAHAAVAEPDLVRELEADPDGPGRVARLLAGLLEVPFHFDRALFARLEEQARSQSVAAPAPMSAARPPAPPPVAPSSPIFVVDPGTRPDHDVQAAPTGMTRKANLEMAVAAVYESGGSADDETDADADPDAIDEVEKSEQTLDEIAGPQKPVRIAPRSDWRPLAAEHAGQLELLRDITGKSTCEGTTSDFLRYFQDRYNQIAKILRGRRELRSAVPIEKVKANAAEVAVIGMVKESDITKNGNRILELEDSTGSIKAFIKSDETQLFALGATLVTDEVIGVVGKASPKGDMLYLTALVRPDIPIPDPSRKRGADVPVCAAFLSDIHVGSRTFLHDNWKKMLGWLSGNGATKREQDIAGRVKYLVVPGDLVDGVGIYKDQQKELQIPDIYDQYGAFSAWLENVPDHIELIVQPGNHDASRPAEPQPAFTKEVQGKFSRRATRFLGNPALFSMHGVKTMGYHGVSLIDFGASVSSLEFSKPLPIMRQMLQSRHLAPRYGHITPVAPEHEDHLVISDVPDLFVTGHVHVPGIEMYRGVQMVNCGTWQSQTSYQKMLNFTPDPARMPLIDLQTLRGTLVDFNQPAAAGAPA